MIKNETFALAVRALLTNRVRAALTILGVTIGSASIVLVVTIALAGKHYVLQLVEGVGSNLVYASYSGEAKSLADEISYGDLEVARTLPDVKLAAGTNDVGSYVVIINGKEVPVTLIGVTDDFQAIRNLLVLQGRFFDNIDMQTSAKACVVSQELAKRFTEDVLGSSIRLGDIQCTVIGVFRERISTFGQSEVRPESVLIPFPLMKYYMGRDFLRTLYVQANSVEAVPFVTDEIKQLLANRHRNSTDYFVENLAAVLDLARRITVALSAVLVLLAIVTLVISGVGIMNIMLVTVTERTREIGVRKAIGAKRTEILFQFVIEALLISGLGALLGIGAAIFAEFLVQRLIPPDSGVHVPISGASLIAALLLSLAAGMFFGYLPASRASRLEATESLRYE